MTNAQLSAAVKLAQDYTVRFIDDNGQHLQDISIFDGYGLADFQPVVCTIEQLAALIRWQCSNFSGPIAANDELNNLRIVGRKKFTVVGKGA